MVPRSAFREDGRVLVVDDEDRITIREVDAFWSTENGDLLVRSGLENGERVVTNPPAIATEGVGVLTIEVERWADFRSVSDEIRERVESLTTQPADAEEPVIAELRVDPLLLRIAVHGDADERSLTEAAHRVRDALAPIPGVATVEIASRRDYEISIGVAEEILTRFGLTFDQVAMAIRRGSADVPGGANPLRQRRTAGQHGGGSDHPGGLRPVPPHRRTRRRCGSWWRVSVPATPGSASAPANSDASCARRSTTRRYSGSSADAMKSACSCAIRKRAAPGPKT